MKVFEKDELKQILDIHVYIALPPEQWSKILEQILLVVLILGRYQEYQAQSLQGEGVEVAAAEGSDVEGSVLAADAGLHGDGGGHCRDIRGLPREQGHDPAPPHLRHPRRVELEPPPVLSRHRGLSQVPEDSEVGPNPD